MSATRIFTARRLVGAVVCSCLALAAAAQDPQQGPATQYPPAQPAYPPATYPQATYPPAGFAPADPAQAGKPPSPLRQLFAGTLSAVIQGADTTGLVGVLVNGLTGGLNNWFERRQQRKAQQAAAAGQPQAPAYPAAGVPATPAYPAAGTYPATQPNAGATPAYTYPGTATSQQATAGAADPYATYPGSANTYDYGAATSNFTYTAPTSSYDWSTTQVYDPRTGQASAAQSGYSLAAPPADTTSIVAGGAYDVYALRPDGSEMPVNAATHEFRTGDRFKVYFRPSLPGRLEVSNINPHGRETRIDSAETAAGQLTTLGPYEFTATKGNEALRFVLWPCSSPQLAFATRDIVNGASAGFPPAQAGGMSFGSCSAIATRSVDKVRTRDIVKVGMDGTTSYALDPVSQSELASGQLAPREFTVYFRHF